MKMKTKRKGNSLATAKKLAKKELRKHLSIAALIELLICVLLLLLVSKDSGISLLTLLVSNPIVPLVFLGCILVSLLIFWVANKDSYLNQVYDKMLADISKTLAEKMLVPGRLIKMNRIYTKEYRDFFIGLAEDKEAEFYAKLGKKDNLIELFVQLKGSKKYRSLGVITKEEFASYCELAEEEFKE